MSIWKRVANLFRSNANAMLDNMEDPLKIADLAIAEMQEHEKKGRQKLVHIDALIRLAEKQAGASKSAHIQQMRTDYKTLKKALEELRAKIDESKKRRHAMFVQLAKQKLQAKKPSIGVPIQTSAIFDASSFDTYDRIIDKIDQLEAEAEALRELSEMDQKKAPHADVIDAEFEEIKKPPRSR